MNFLTYQYLIKYSLGKPGSLKAYQKAIKNQFLTEDELSNLSFVKTIKLLNDSYINVPWYTKRFNEIGLNPKDITRLEHFTQVPVLTRQELIDNYYLFFSKKINPKSLKISTTGGSTGTPLKIGMQNNGIRELQKWQMFSWWGLNPTVNIASIYRGLPVKGIKKIAFDFINWPQKTIRMDATNMTNENIKNYIKLSQKTKPQLVHGYVGAVDAIADYILENNIEIPAPKVVWLTAAPINAIQEEKISRAFNAPVCDQYGCSEIYFIAAECNHKEGLHIFADSVKVEILNDKNQSVENETYGKIVITNLDDFHFPLIRYENGDMGRLLNKKCSCGKSLPLMDKVKGRTSDNMVMPNGTILAGEYLTTIFDDYTNDVRQFQIIQHKNLDITVNIVFQNSVIDPKVVMSKVENELKKRINNQVALHLVKVNNISNINGKLRFIIKE